MQRKPSKLWDMFDKLDSKANKKEAVCRLCSNVYSYFSSTSNLKTHLRRVHKKAFLHLEQVVSTQPRRQSEIPKTKRTKLWKFFAKTNDMIATCRLCHAAYKRGSSTSNLLSHLRVKHPEVLYLNKSGFLHLPPKRPGSDGESHADCSDVTHKKKENDSQNGGQAEGRTRRKTSSDSNRTSCSDSSDTEFKNEDGVDSDSGSPPDVWTYFEKEGAERARCVVCRETLLGNTADLIEHMKEKHSKLVVATDTFDSVRNSTEILYLDVDQPIQSSKPGRRKSFKRKPVIDRHTANTTPVTEKPVQESKGEEDIDVFGRYVVTLLRDVPKEECIQMQADIINFIVTKKRKGNTQITKSIPLITIKNGGLRPVIPTLTADTLMTASPKPQTVEISTKE